ncbi:hypothetical protein QMK33_10000 [Hymenobacter sp. H14-R3]|uniref:hypothetical protein n=1 Tax=Hymenobacter sp. H14-R3 TaxID=3046308 RepID=UPI0024BABC09|nr:hypothetical protein [Hymenobacter sp. H14-R3]MDJ0365487.1 hypothetical protein [Hymenobacter sp. H14-R3]
MIKNEGEKTFSQLHLIHGANAYYEFTDSGGSLHAGTSVGNLSLGDLAATESREVRLWAYSELLFAKSGLTVTYADGRVVAKPVTIDGIEIVQPDSRSLWLGSVIMYGSLAFGAYFLIRLIISNIAKRT